MLKPFFKTFATALLVTLCAAAEIATTGVTANASISVGQNVQVSAKNPQRLHGEVLISADPTDANHLLACSIAGTYPNGMFDAPVDVGYVSFDGGQSWTPTVERRPFSVDPACILGSNGEAYFAGIGGPLDSEHYFTYKNSYVFHSTDGGRTWSKPQDFPDGDRDFFSIDLTNGPHHNRVYYHLEHSIKTLDGQKMYGMYVFHSDDGGKTFSPGIMTDTSKEVVQVGQSTVLPDGTMLAELHEVSAITPQLVGGRYPNETTHIKVVASKDGGFTFSDAHDVSDWVGPFDDYTTPYALPMIASDNSNSPYRKRAYVVWNDARYGHGNIFLSYSDDDGVTWSKPTIADDTGRWPAGTGPDCFNPVVAVNRNGVVGVIWSDRRAIKDGVGSNIRFAASYDGGLTFTSSVRVSSAPSLLNPLDRFYLDGFTSGGGKGEVKNNSLEVDVGPDKRYAILGGDTAGLAADADGVFHPLWADDRTGVSQVWTARVTVSGLAVKNGDPALSALSDVTRNVAVRAHGSTFDRQTDRVTLRLSVSNTSKEPIQGPIRLRIIGLTSVLGTPELTNSDNGQTGLGAIVTFQAQNDSTLSKGDETVTRELVFAIRNAHRDVPDPSWPMEEYIRLTARAFAVASEKGTRLR